MAYNAVFDGLIIINPDENLESLDCIKISRYGPIYF